MCCSVNLSVAKFLHFGRKKNWFVVFNFATLVNSNAFTSSRTLTLVIFCIESTPEDTKNFSKTVPLTFIEKKAERSSLETSSISNKISAGQVLRSEMESQKSKKEFVKPTNKGRPTKSNYDWLAITLWSELTNIRHTQKSRWQSQAWTRSYKNSFSVNYSKLIFDCFKSCDCIQPLNRVKLQR